MSGEEERGFKIQDRRRFSGQAGGGAETVDHERVETPPSPSSDESARTAAEHGAGGAEPGGEVEAITFSTLVISLSTQALMHLGEIPDPISGKVAKNVAGARQVIDMLGVLREKTQGNLERAEQQLLDGMLYDLRMKYVEVVRR